MDAGAIRVSNGNWADYILGTETMTIPIRKRGYTLIEMVAVLILVSALIPIIGSLLRRSLSAYSQTIDRAFQVQASDRWTERLRQDIHQAVVANISEDQLSMTLKMSAQENVRYYQDGAATARQRHVGGRALAIERSPWIEPLRFKKTESPVCSLIEVAIEPGVDIQARLGIEIDASLEEVEFKR